VFASVGCFGVGVKGSLSLGCWGLGVGVRVRAREGVGVWVRVLREVWV